MATTAAETMKQAGDGVSKKKDPASFHIEHFQDSVMSGLVLAYQDYAKDFPLMNDFVEFMFSDKANAMGLFPRQDLDHSLSTYFISSCWFSRTACCGTVIFRICSILLSPA
jgi:hypothetical protein